MEIKIKKGASIQTILSTLVIAVLFFTAGYLMINANETQVGLPHDSTFDLAYQSTNSTNKNLQDITNNFQNFSDAVRETDATDFGYYGFKGTLAIMKLPFSIIGMATGFMASILNIGSLIPTPLIVALMSIITFIIIFAAISFLTNRGKDQT